MGPGSLTGLGPPVFRDDRRPALGRPRRSMLCRGHATQAWPRLSSAGLLREEADESERLKRPYASLSRRPDTFPRSLILNDGVS